MAKRFIFENIFWNSLLIKLTNKKSRKNKKNSLVGSLDMKSVWHFDEACSWGISVKLSSLSIGTYAMTNLNETIC